MCVVPRFDSWLGLYFAGAKMDRLANGPATHTTQIKDKICFSSISSTFTHPLYLQSTPPLSLPYLYPTCTVPLPYTLPLPYLYPTPSLPVPYHSPTCILYPGLPVPYPFTLPPLPYVLLRICIQCYITFDYDLSNAF